MSGARKLKIAVGVSGGGRSLKNLISHQSDHLFEVALVFSSSPSVAANDVAVSAKLPLIIIDFSKKNYAAAQELLYGQLAEHGIELVVLAGFLKLLPIDGAWRNRIINIHPALLPKFGGPGMYGIHVHEAVLAAHESITGATVHFVNEKFDDGGIIAQAVVKIPSHATAEQLAELVFKSECNLLPWVIDELSQGRLPSGSITQRVEGRDF